MATKRYRYVGALDEVEVPDHGLVVKRGDQIEVEGVINNADFELVKDKPASPGKENN